MYQKLVQREEQVHDRENQIMPLRASNTLFGQQTLL